MKINFIAFFILLICPFPSFSEQYGAEVVIRTCVGGYCSPQTSPSPLAGTGQPNLDKARYEAYRYEWTIHYQNAVNDLQNQTQTWAEQKAKAENLSLPEYNKLVDQALKDLDAKIPDLPADLPTLQERRLRNPFPSDPVAKKFVEEELDQIWKGIEQQSPAQVAADINKVFEKLRYNSNESDHIKDSLQEKSDFILKELVMSQVVNGDGIINAPFVEPMGVSLSSNPLTEAGFATRQLLNQNVANESLMRAKCLSGQESSVNCALVDEYSSLMKLNFLATDRWASEFRPGRVETSPAFEQHLDDLKVMVAFGEGFVNGVAGAIDGIKNMVLHPIDTASAIGSAIYHYDKTYDALKQAVTRVWDQFQSGDAEVRARILGEVGFEVASMLVPASKVSVLEKLSVASKGVNQVLRKVAEPILNAQRLGVVKNLDEAIALTEVVKNTLEKFPTEKIDKLVMSSKDYFHGWKKGWVHLETQTAEFRNALMQAGGHEPGWMNGSKIFKFETTDTEILFRVFKLNDSVSNIRGNWLLNGEDILGFTPVDLKMRYALPEIPTHIVEVHVPAGTSLFKGRVGSNKFGDLEGAIQYETEFLLPQEFFMNPKVIDGVVDKIAD